MSATPETPLDVVYKRDLEVMPWKFWWNLNDFLAVVIAEGINHLMVDGTTAHTEAEALELARLYVAFKDYIDDEDDKVQISSDTWQLLAQWFPRLWD